MGMLADKARSITIKAVNKQNKEEPFPDELYQHFQNMIFDAAKRGDRQFQFYGKKGSCGSSEVNLHNR